MIVRNGVIQVKAIYELQYIQIGLKIAYYRKLRGLTQEELAERINKSPAFIGHIEAPNINKAVSLDTLFDIAKELDMGPMSTGDTPGNGSSDIGNVSWVAPSMNLYTPYPFGGHTVENVENGKTEYARSAMVSGSKIFSWIALDCITDPDYLAAVKAEYQAAVAHAN